MYMRWLIGIDEAGRGPLAGPVAVGAFAVSVTYNTDILSGIRDSKTLSERQREAWAGTLATLADARRAVSLVGAPLIDRHGIVWAVRTALARSLSKLSLDPVACTVLLDGGLRAPAAYTDQTTIVRGDASEPVISAAAILAKVARDRHMVQLAARYPAYGFDVHKGYGTVAHRVAIETFGLCAVHRRSFCHASRGNA